MFYNEEEEKNTCYKAHQSNMAPQLVVTDLIYQRTSDNNGSIYQLNPPFYMEILNERFFFGFCCYSVKSEKLGTLEKNQT